MEENDGEQVDSTLPPEWSLPELPKVHTPSLSTAEFEEIFGGSDEEDNFPLSMGVLRDHMELDNVLPSPNELFRSTISDSLSLGTKPVDVLADSMETETIKNPLNKSAEEAAKEVVENQKPLSRKMNNSSDTCSNIQSTSKTCEEKRTASKTDSMECEKKEEGETEKDGSDKEGLPGPTAIDNIGRRSARIRARIEKKEDDVEVTVKTEQEESSELDEESLVDRLLEKDKEVFQQKESSEGVSQSSSVDANPTSSQSDEDSDGSFGGGDEEDSDDPDKLWCICLQPHDDRFMICCDSCGEWYHGDCVGISVAEGKRMEKTGQEYVCSKCVDHEKEIKAEREKNRSIRLARREQIREKQIAELREKRLSGSQSAEVPDDELFLPDKLTEKDKAALRKKKLRIRDAVRKPCLGPGCEQLAIRPCLYCSEECIVRHCEFSLKKLSVRGLLPPKGNGITLYEPTTKKMLTGLSAPDEQALLPFLKEHRSFKVFVPSQKVLPASKKPVKKLRKESDKEDQIPDSSTSKPTLDSEAIRGHAKKALKQVLMSRCHGASSVEKTEDEIAQLADDIELKLYNLHNQDVCQKYRSKCRSLLFNLKDTKNQVLFKKLVTGDLTTRQLVRMTPDQLASEELAEWREKTIKKELDLIKEVAIEEAQMSSSGVIRKMTYKGEVEIERHSEIEATAAGDKADEVSSTTPEFPPSGDAAPTPTTPIAKEKIESKLTKEPSTGTIIKDPPLPSILTDILTDTTSQHSSHVFDQNCDICMGKKKAEKEPVSQIKAAVTPDCEDLPSPDSRTVDSELMDTEVASPDPIHSYSIPPLPSPLRPLWNGAVSMHGLETCSVVAYHVSGPAESIEHVFPDSLLIIGRIAHVQVWDYIDKLKSSLTKEIVVLRLDRMEEDRNAYLDMMDYFLQKHRYGVVQCTNISGIKDMYLVPLQYDDPPPPQLLPFNGPGLPINRRDTFLCIMTKMKFENPTTPDTPRKRKYSGKVHFRGDSSSPQVDIPTKKPRLQVLVGFGDSTPPHRDDREEQTSSPIEEVEAETKHKPFFYRETEIMNTTTPTTATTLTLEESEKKPSLPDTGIKSILSSLSDEKIKELASVAMSTFGTVKDTYNTTESSPALAESTSLMKGEIPKYNISTAELGKEEPASDTSHDPRSRSLSLDERLRATFGHSVDRSSFNNPPSLSDLPQATAYGSSDYSQPHPYSNPPGHPQSYSNYPSSDPNFPSEQRYPSTAQNIYQQRQSQPSNPQSTTDHSDQHQQPHEYNPSNYQPHYSPHQSGEADHRPQPQQHHPYPDHQPPPHSQQAPPHRYHSDYRSGHGPSAQSRGRYDYHGNREEDRYAHRGGRGRDIGDRRSDSRGFQDGYRDRGGNWSGRDHDSYRGRDSYSSRSWRGGGGRDRRNDDYRR